MHLNYHKLCGVTVLTDISKILECNQRECVTGVNCVMGLLTWLEVLMSTPPLRCSKTLSMFPALAARRKLVLLSDCKRHKGPIRARVKSKPYFSGIYLVAHITLFLYHNVQSFLNHYDGDLVAIISIPNQAYGLSDHSKKSPTNVGTSKREGWFLCEDPFTNGWISYATPDNQSNQANDHDQSCIILLIKSLFSVEPARWKK